MGVFAFDPTLSFVSLFDSLVQPLVETHTGLVYVDARKFYEAQLPKIDVIKSMIRQASLVIVELSKKNPNVFLELGFALAYEKRVVLICGENAWHEEWSHNPPFDLQGREVLIYRDEPELKVRLGAFIAGTLNRTQRVTLTWAPADRRCHIRSASEFSLAPDGQVWSSETVQFPFTIAYKATLEQPTDRPDVRLFIASGSQKYPQIVCIFPWEASELDPTQAECHIDFDLPPADADRIQQISVCPKARFSSMEPWTVFMAFRQPNLVLESSLFENRVERLVVSMNELLHRGLPLTGGLRVGFFAKTATTISAIDIREVYEL